MDTQPQELRKSSVPFSDIPIGTGAMAVMGVDGDTKYLWDKNNADEVAIAKSTFDNFRKKGYLAFKVTGKDGAKGDQVTEFDPEAERYIFAPQMQGG